MKTAAKTKAAKLAAPLLLVGGLCQMAGDLLHIPLLKGVGAATVIAPAPKVFSAVKGFETYSTRFFLEWSNLPRGAAVVSEELTAERYARLRGPYNRRNVYGATLAYGPVLPAELRTPVMRYALCGERPIVGELGLSVDPRLTYLRVRFVPRPGTTMAGLPTQIEAPCP